MASQIGDKVRLRSSSVAGSRGIVRQIRDGLLVIELADGETVRLPNDAVTNLSLAARKAWKSMPDRNVGRPRGSGNLDRQSVTLRIDRILWERFRAQESAGVIANRTATINEWLREKLDQLVQRGEAG